MPDITTSLPSRDVLIITGGTSPQVVTETVYALVLAKTASEQRPFFPGRIVCVVTANVAERFGDRLVQALESLAAEVGVAAAWGTPVIAVPKLGDGTLLEDVRSQDDSVLFGDFITELVRQETQDPATRVYLSLAGGRKTMTYYGGAARGRWGRPQDKLLHVLLGVSPNAANPTLRPEDFERLDEFWFPRKNRSALPSTGSRQADGIDAGDAIVNLHEVPFVPLRDLLPPWVTAEPLSYAAWVERFRAALADRLILRLTAATRHVQIGDLADFHLAPNEFALYQLMAEWARDEIPGAGPEGVGPDHHGWLTTDILAWPELADPNPIWRFMEIYASACVCESEKPDLMRHNITPKPANQEQREGNRRFFTPILSRLRDQIQIQVKFPSIINRFCPPKITSKKEKKFGLCLSPKEISILY